MNGLIPLGIPLSEIAQLLTTGLSMGEAPPPTPTATSGGALSLDTPTIIVEEEDAPFESAGFAIPSGGTRITWQVIGTTTEVVLEGSLDFAHFNILDTATGAGVRSLVSGVTSLRALVNDGEDITVIVTIKREKL